LFWYVAPSTATIDASVTLGVAATWLTDILGFNTASAPNASTLTTPANGSFLDVTISPNDQFSGIANSTDGANINARAFRIKASTASSYNYLNVSTNALQSTIVWNTVNIAPGASGTFTVPGLTNGVTDNWSMADQESLANLQGAFAADFSVNFQLAPNLSINSPTGSETTTNAPSLSYTPTPASGASVTGGRWLIYPLAVTQASGFSINIGAGTIPAGAVSDVSWTGNPLTVAIQSGVTLTNGAGYVAYAAVTETGNEWSSTISSSFTISLDQPATPSITVVPSIDTSNTPPLVTITVQGHDNILSADDASFEGGIGTWVGSNATLSQDSANHLDGSYSLKLVTAAAGAANAYTSPTAYAAVPGETYTVIIPVKDDGTHHESCYGYLQWLDSSGNAISSLDSATITTSSEWQYLITSGVAPSNAATFRPVFQIVNAAAASESFWLDEVSIAPGNLGYELEVLSDNPVAYWPLSDAAGSTTVADATGNGNTGTVNGGVTLGEPGVVAQFPNETSGLFNGTTGYIQTTVDPIGSAISLEAWVKSTATSASAQIIFDSGAAAGATGTGLWLNVGGAVEAVFEGLACTSNIAIAGDNKWHHVVATFNGSDISIYIDGVLEGQTASTTAVTAGYNGRIGEYGNGTTDHFTGYIGQVGVYATTALSAARIQAHYNAALATGSFVEKWTRGGLAGSMYASILRSDGLYVRGAYATAPALISTPSQTLVIDDYEVTPGVAYTYTAQTSATLSANAVISSPSSAASNSATVNSTVWWWVNPLNPSSAFSPFVTAYTGTQMEQATSHLVMGQPYPTIISSVMGGKDGTLTVQTVTPEEWQALESVINARQTLWMTNALGDGLYVRIGPAPGGMSGGGYGVTSKQAQLAPGNTTNPVRTVTLTYQEVARP